MSKFLAALKNYEEAFASISFDPTALAEDPEALAAFVAAQSGDTHADLSGRVATLEAANADLLAKLDFRIADDEAATELLAETQTSLDAAREQLALLQGTDTAQALAAAESLAGTYANGLLEAGIKVPSAGVAPHTAADIAAAILAKQSVHASELLASHGFKGALDDAEGLAADETTADPFPGLSGIARTAAALKARRSSR